MFHWQPPASRSRWPTTSRSSCPRWASQYAAGSTTSRSATRARSTPRDAREMMKSARVPFLSRAKRSPLALVTIAAVSMWPRAHTQNGATLTEACRHAVAASSIWKTCGPRSSRSGCRRSGSSCGCGSCRLTGRPARPPAAPQALFDTRRGSRGTWRVIKIEDLVPRTLRDAMPDQLVVVCCVRNRTTTQCRSPRTCMPYTAVALALIARADALPKLTAADFMPGTEPDIRRRGDDGRLQAAAVCVVDYYIHATSYLSLTSVDAGAGKVAKASARTSAAPTRWATGSAATRPRPPAAKSRRSRTRRSRRCSRRCPRRLSSSTALRARSSRRHWGSTCTRCSSCTWTPACVRERDAQRPARSRRRLAQVEKCIVDGTTAASCPTTDRDAEAGLQPVPLCAQRPSASGAPVATPYAPPRLGAKRPARP